MRRSGVLGERDFRNLYCARAFSLIGDGIVPVALALGVLQTANSATALPPGHQLRGRIKPGPHHGKWTEYPPPPEAPPELARSRPDLP
jgi:hypothetical protein